MGGLVLTMLKCNAYNLLLSEACEVGLLSEAYEVGF